MEKNKLNKIMQDLSIQDLKKFLGNNLVEMLIEWTPDNETLFSKSKLANMIEIIHGYEILKNKEFREAILYRLSTNDLLSFNEDFGPYNTSNVEKLISNVSNKNWGKNKVTKHFLKLLHIQEDILYEETDDQKDSLIVEPYDRFFELLDYQFVIKQKTLKMINSGIDTPRLLVHMPTGTGKTKTTMHTIIHHFNFNLNRQGAIIWLAHTKELLEQALETLEVSWKHLGLGNLNVYKLWGNFGLDVKEHEKINGFIIGGFQKMISIMKNNPEIFNRICNDCSLVVVDEAHKAVADETKKLINELMRKKADMTNRALIGLSATPGRNMLDNADNNRLVSMFENRIVSIDVDVLNQINLDKFEAQNMQPERDIISYLQERKILANIAREKLTYGSELTEQELGKLKVEATANGYDDFSKEFLKIIGLNKKRNMAILNRLIQLDVDKIPTIVFACSVEHGKLLSAALSLRGIKNEYVFGDMNPLNRKKAINQFKDRNNDMNILINYEVLTTGFDATNIRCVFITRPTQSIVLYSQMLGRGLRGPKMGGNETCLLVDLEDNLEKYTNESMAFSYFNNYWGN